VHSSQNLNPHFRIILRDHGQNFNCAISAPQGPPGIKKIGKCIEKIQFLGNTFLRVCEKSSFQHDSRCAMVSPITLLKRSHGSQRPESPYCSAACLETLQGCQYMQLLHNRLIHKLHPSSLTVTGPNCINAHQLTSQLFAHWNCLLYEITFYKR